MGSTYDTTVVPRAGDTTIGPKEAAGTFACTSSRIALAMTRTNLNIFHRALLVAA